MDEENLLNHQLVLRKSRHEELKKLFKQGPYKVRLVWALWDKVRKVYPHTMEGLRTNIHCEI